jgi:hypothetical protein
MNTNLHHPQGSLASRHGVKALRIVGLTFAGVGLAVLFALAFGLVVKVLWNWLMPVIFGLGTITFWQAFGIVLLAKLLFGGFAHSHRDHDTRFGRRFESRIKKFARPEENREDDAPTPGNGTKWRHFRQYWHDEGRASYEAYVQRMKIPEEKESSQE